MARIKLPDMGGTEIERMWGLLRPEMAEAVVGFNAAVSGGMLDPRVYELVRYRIAQINDCPNCLQHRAAPSVRHEHGITEDLYEHVAEYATSELYSDAEKVAIEYAERFATDHRNIDDDLFARLGCYYDEHEVVELTVTLARNLAIGRLFAVLQLDQACTLDFADRSARPQ